MRRGARFGSASGAYSIPSNQTQLYYKDIGAIFLCVDIRILRGCRAGLRQSAISRRSQRIPQQESPVPRRIRDWKTPPSVPVRTEINKQTNKELHSMANPLRIGFVGSGGMASAHLKAIGPMADAEIVAFCDVDPAKSEARVAELKGIRPDAAPQTFAGPEAMLAATNPDVVYVLLPPFAHGAAERACLAHRVPFFVEKPIGLDMGLTRE